MPYIPNAVISGGPPGSQGPAGTSSITLGANSSVGASSVTLNATAYSPTANNNYILIDAFTAEAELRLISSVVGATVNLANALEYAHSSGDSVIVVTENVLCGIHWGCKGNNSTDDQIPLQEAIYQCSIYGDDIWLDGQNRAYHIISQPIILPQNCRLSSFQIKASAAFAPAESNNAMVMTQNGSVRAFTADPATDIITCSSAHSLPGDNTGVVFQGTNLPGGLTGGKFYYARDRTPTTFKVSATSGGAAVDITSAGSGGRVWLEVYAANAKPRLDNVYLDGDLVTDLNGMLMSVQQPGYANNLRTDNFDGVGIIMKGQQYVMTNLEQIQNRVCLRLDDMLELYVYGYNAEQTNIAIQSGTGGFDECCFIGMHLELTGSPYGVSGEIGVDLNTIGGHNNTFDTIHMAGSSDATFLESTAAASLTSYVIRNLWWSSGQASSGQVMVSDSGRSLTLDQWTDCQKQLSLLVAHKLPDSQSFDDPFPSGWVGSGGRFISLGSQNDDQALIRVKPGSAQTADQIKFLDTSGNRVSGFNKGGVFFTERNTVPADADLVAGELTLWFDDTNGAAKLMIKAKQADGTVRTGNVALA